MNKSGISGSICLLLISRIRLSSTSESVNTERCIFGHNFAGLRSKKTPHRKQVVLS